MCKSEAKLEPEIAFKAVHKFSGRGGGGGGSQVFVAGMLVVPLRGNNSKIGTA